MPVVPTMTMMAMFTRAGTVASLLFCLLLATDINAEKDSDYYYPGFSNPNAKNAMYWKDSINVLQDLDQFSALYIKYHGCVWSKYGTRYGSGEDYDEQDGDDDGDNNGNGCGGFGGEYFWYMGRTQCFKAQVAYSLYGVLKSNSKNSGCTKKTYINSFFTTYGVESFAGPLGLGVDDANSQCESMEPDGDAEGGDYDGYAADDDYLDDGYQFYNYAAYTSQGTGCSASGRQFTTDKYSGAFCHGKNFIETVDTLDSFNAAVESMECTQIYDANAANDDDRRNLEDEDYNFEDMEAVQILSFSKSCSLRQYPNDCPDPYGIKKKYGKKIDRAFATKTGSFRNFGKTILQGLSFLCGLGGLLALGATYTVYRAASDRAVRKLRKKERKRQKKEMAASGNNNNKSEGSSFVPVMADKLMGNSPATSSPEASSRSRSSRGRSPEPKNVDDKNGMEGTTMLEDAAEYAKPWTTFFKGEEGNVDKVTVTEGGNNAAEARKKKKKSKSPAKRSSSLVKMFSRNKKGGNS